MARISIVLLLTGDEDAEKACAGSLLAQASKEFEVVCVADDGGRALTDEMASLGPVVVTAGGLPGEKRNAAIASCGGDYVLFSDTDTKMSPALVQSLAAQVEKAEHDKAGLQVAVFHTQRYDRASKAYLSRRMAPRKSTMVTPYAPAFHASKAFQRLGAGVGNKLFSRSYLQESGVSLSGFTAHGDDTGSMRLLARSESVISTAFPLAIARFDPAGEANALGADGSRRWLEDAVSLAGDFDVEGQARAFLPSYLEWLAGACVSHLELLAPELKASFMDDMRELARPVMEGLVVPEMKPAAWGSYDRFEAACLDWLELYERYAELSEERKEEGYERARLELMAHRLRKAASGAEPAAKTKRFGLFRR